MGDREIDLGIWGTIRWSRRPLSLGMSGMVAVAGLLVLTEVVWAIAGWKGAAFFICVLAVSNLVRWLRQ